jgi:UDP:flavonoid glycosyltransferase YjiC (YdhE family)
VFPAPLAAELEQRPWVTVSLAPGVVPSAFTRPGPDSGAAGEGRLARRKNSFIWECGRRLAGLEIDPLVNRLRARHGLAPVRDAMFSAPSARLNLQLCSGLFAPRPPDWPEAVRYGGFCFYDPPGPARLPAEVEQFLAEGERPVLFTLGSVAVDLPGDFFEIAGKALKRLGGRGILLVGREENRPRELSRDVLAVPYLPFGLIMPRVRAVVHQAGIGTLAEVLRAGLPSVAVPFAFDQPNNARRMEELGLGKMLGPRERSVEDFAAALRLVLTDGMVARAGQFGDRLRAEDGVGRSCEVLESAFAPAGGGK